MSIHLVLRRMLVLKTTEAKAVNAAQLQSQFQQAEGAQ